MRELVVMRGLPGSGKSTRARELARGGHLRVSKDDIRSMMGVKSGEDEHTVHALFSESVRAGLGRGRSVVADCTHVVERDIDLYRKMAHSYGDVLLRTEVMRVGPEQCIARDAARSGDACVGADVVWRMWERSRWAAGWPADLAEVFPKRFERIGLARDESLPDAFVCDLDGTAMMIGDRSPYDASRCDSTDSPCAAVQRVTSALSAAGLTALFVSGRSDADRDPTERSLAAHYGHCWPARAELHMRRAGDQRRDDAVKGDIFEKHILGRYNVVVVFDDRPSVVRFWRSLGLTVMQLDDREF